MTDLCPTTAFGMTKPMTFASGALTVSERIDTGLASLTMRQGGRRPAPLGLTLPEPGGLSQGDGIWAIWIGPGQWLIGAEARSNDDIAAFVGGDDGSVSVTEQTDGWAVIDIVDAGDGSRIEALAERLVNLDPNVLGPGSATPTGLDQMRVFVIRWSPAWLSIIGPRSAAGSLWSRVIRAAALRSITSGPAG